MGAGVGVWVGVDVGQGVLEGVGISEGVGIPKVWAAALTSRLLAALSVREVPGMTEAWTVREAVKPAIRASAIRLPRPL